MLKNILKLNGAQQLNVNEQKAIKGGLIPDLSKICGAYTFTSTQSQCMSLTNYSPIWNSVTKKCSVIGTACSGGNL